MTLDKITYNSLKYMKSGKKYILTEDLVITVESHRGNSKYVNYPPPKGGELRASTRRTCLVQDRTR